MPVTCQYFEAQRSTQLFSPTFKSPSLYLEIPMLTIIKGYCCSDAADRRESVNKGCASCVPLMGMLEMPM